MKRAKVNYTMTLRTPWSRIYNFTLKKSNYGLFSTTLTDERKPLFKWVGPLVSNDWIVWKKAGSKIEINSLEDLKKYRVGGYKGDAVALYLQSQNITVIEVQQDKRNAQKLEKGSIDLWATGRYAAPYLASVVAMPTPVEEFSIRSVDMYLALNINASETMVTKLQSALDSMKKDGSYNMLQERYQ